MIPGRCLNPPVLQKHGVFRRGPTVEARTDLAALFLPAPVPELAAGGKTNGGVWTEESLQHSSGFNIPSGIFSANTILSINATVRRDKQTDQFYLSFMILYCVL